MVNYGQLAAHLKCFKIRGGNSFLGSTVLLRGFEVDMLHRGFFSDDICDNLYSLTYISF